MFNGDKWTKEQIAESQKDAKFHDALEFHAKLQLGLKKILFASIIFLVIVVTVSTF